MIDKSYLEWTCQSSEWEKTISSISSKCHLNCEQDCAFHIVANHACQPESEQLKMHIGGMDSTGKSQVFKALIRFFELQNEGHQFGVIVPTRSMAALLGGSMYHSVFGVND